MLLSLYWVYRLFRDGGKRELVLSILFCSLTILSHPEVAIHTAAGCILLWLIYARSLRTAHLSFVVLSACLLFTAPWLAGVLSHHGLAPFLSALNTGSYGSSIWRAFISALFASQSVIPILLISRLLGIVWGVWKRKTFLVVWAILPYLIEPRSAYYCLLPILYVDGARPYRCAPAFVDYFHKDNSTSPRIEFDQRAWLNITLLLVMIYLFVESSLFGFKID
ncbi:hypothetical protein [Candidatus Villigracilis saccharophilus]|uniref:hypothetical protein n=1 Tax=Candidatus Villigracilis saccharophilus TaxID=3140684 RepID=UPI003136AA95|nr:hypothetical protein [Anaerolineales bacterium]